MTRERIIEIEDSILNADPAKEGVRSTSLMADSGFTQIRSGMIDLECLSARPETLAFARHMFAMLKALEGKTVERAVLRNIVNYETNPDGTIAYLAVIVRNP